MALIWVGNPQPSRRFMFLRGDETKAFHPVIQLCLIFFLAAISFKWLGPVTLSSSCRFETFCTPPHSREYEATQRSLHLSVRPSVCLSHSLSGCTVCHQFCYHGREISLSRAIPCFLPRRAASCISLQYHFVIKSPRLAM